MNDRGIPSVRCSLYETSQLVYGVLYQLIVTSSVPL